MQIVIDIDEKYKKLLDSGDANGSVRKSILLAVTNGTVLPKGHGRLIDADALKSECYSIVDPKGIYSELKIIEDYYIDDASTIIEADKEN